ncbi:hypothetical protein VP01_1266g9 [Puccinia sorghi]|uniref:PRKR-interacting protein 1 n=1 Tax=Puccinia sorghi TaxID=27349 RepID=A0A0L6VP36_9BASI|nr:hypothetical protein VP01_1266g9 [Puccinia sorghi]
MQTIHGWNTNRGEQTGKNSNGNNPSKKPKLDPEFLPANKHAPTPLEKQRAEVAKLLQNPAREIHLPKAPREKSIRPPRDMMKNVQGSSAGAGSGEFHVYKQSRRREYERLRLMDENEEKERLRVEFEKKQKELRAQVEAKTNKNRLKRQKKKDLRKKKKQKDGQDRPGNGDQSAGSSSEDSHDEDAGDNHAKRKRKKLGAAPVAERVVFKKPNQGSGLDDEDQDDHDEKLGRAADPPEENTDNNGPNNSMNSHPSTSNVPVVQST